MVTPALSPFVRMLVFIAAVAGSAVAYAQDAQGSGESMSQEPDDLIVFKENGGWCWYQDERALVIDGQLVFGSVAASTRANSEVGDIDVTSYRIATGELTYFKLSPRFQPDDHDVPALLELADGRILAAYTTHGGRRTTKRTDGMYWRITEKPGDISAWGPEQFAEIGGGISYSNLHLLSAEGNRIYNFHRSSYGEPWANNPNLMVSEDGGETFSHAGRLLFWPKPSADDPRFTGIDGARPYLKYASNGIDTIHFVTTEDHPRAYDNSIYHGYIKGGKIYHSDGREVGLFSTTRETAIQPTSLTRVFAGDADNVAWTIDLHLDAKGYPYTVFSVQKDGADERGQRGAREDGQDHRFYYGRWDGKRWQVNEIAYAGTRLYPKEDDYTGLAALHPNNPDVVFISTDADPKTGEPLISEADGQRHHEIYAGRTRDFGKTWAWTPLTANSTVDNLRPIVPIWEPGKTVLLWLRGRFTTFIDYDPDVVGIIRE